MPCKRSSAVPIPFGFRLSVAPVAPLRSASSDTISSMRFRAASSILAQYCLLDTQLCAGPENSEASVWLRSYGCLFFCVAFNLAGCAGGVVLRSRRDAASGPFGLLLPRRKARAAGGAIRPPQARMEARPFVSQEGVATARQPALSACTR